MNLLDFVFATITNASALYLITEALSVMKPTGNQRPCQILTKI